jgi:phosphatidylserine/phosphatidylglycerophosphate/cardiolipin synthase-like enzyme
MLLVNPHPTRRPTPCRIPRGVTALLMAAAMSACGGAQAAPVPRSVPVAYPATAGTPVSVGADTVRILPRGSTAFPVIASLIAGAHTAVHVEMYEFGRVDLAAALIDAHRRGVAVTVIDDPSVEVTSSTMARLRAAGVDVLDYPVRKGMIDHVKLLVVDGRVAVVGGINWGPRSDRNHDVDAEITGPAAANLEGVFLADLVTCGRSVAEPAPLPDPRVLVASTLPGTDIRPLALQLIDSAHSTLDLALYVLTDTGVVHAVERAHQRGVAVRVLLDPSQRPSDGPAAALAAAGVAVRIYRSSGEKLHAKLGIADGTDALFGSANWTSGGFERNHELDVLMVDSPAIARQLTAMVDADWSASAS